MSIDIVKPTLLLNKQIAQTNIRTMAEKARRKAVNFRPHFKTHQAAVIGRWFRAEGVTQITVSSLAMAQYFAADGWHNILIAFPVNIRQLAGINELANQIELHLLLESIETAVALNAGLETNVHIWLKVDAGYGRTGLPWHNGADLLALADRVAELPRLRLTGILTHGGHSYGAENAAAVTAIYRETVDRLNQVRRDLRAQGHQLLVSVGDTPSASIVAEYGEVDEIRPGNFVFYDLMQQQLGACRQQDIAVGVACPIVAKHDHDRRLILYGGAVHLSKEFLLADGRPIYGRAAPLQEDGWGALLPSAKIDGVSQEHGILHVDQESFQRLAVGDLVVVLPVHSCLTADLYGHYTTIEGELITKMRTNS